MTKTVDVQQAQKKDNKVVVNELYDSIKGEFDQVVVVGLKKGNAVDIATTIPTYPFVQWMLKRGSFKLLLLEEAQVNAEVEQAKPTEVFVPEEAKVVDDSPSV